MIQSSYYNFDFNQKSSNKFEIFQDELKILQTDIVDLNQVKFKNESIKYEVSCENIKKFKNYVAILPIKDDIKLLKYTIEKIKKFDVLYHMDFIIVDDRPQNKVIKDFVLHNNLTYVSINNEKGFNFSMLNNIAALLAKNNGAKNIILWNSDLWPDNDKTIPRLIEKFENNNASVAGTKLLYPNTDIIIDGKDFFDLSNIETHFPDKVKSFYNSVQYGGSNFIFNNQLNSYVPTHSHRFKQKDNIFVNTDKIELFITGAFQIIKLQDFIDVGGLNPSLSKNFQDVEFCFKLLDKDKKILYFGHDIHLVHAESVTLTKNNKYDIQMTSDTILFSKLCGKNYLKIIS